MTTSSAKPKKRPEPFRVPNYTGIEGDKTHHLTGPFLPQTPLGGTTPTHSRSASPTASRSFAAQVARRSALVRWVIEPALSFQILLLPLVLSINWKVLAPYVNPGAENPFSIFLISGRVPATSPDNALYRKTWWDILFIAYYVVVFSFIRQSLSIKVSRPLAKYFGLRNENKIDRFGEQFYAVVYFSFFGAWGYRVMTQLPTYWYNTAAFWNAYPTWAMRPELKAYYLIQFAYWWQQLLVLILGLEKPRKDYWELVAHHFVTLWLVGWSYLLNLTLIGNAVYMSMDIPDVFLALSKMLNYIQWNTAKTYAFGIFFVIWTYFRHYLNLWILWSVWAESSLVPDWTKQWNWSEGVYMPGWMKYQIFLPLALLQGLNVFWYTLMFKILIRGLITRDVDDHRSDDEDDGDDDSHKKED